jgi:hypothetical protein
MSGGLGVGFVTFVMAALALSTPESHSIAELQGQWTGSVEQFSHDIEGSFPVQFTVDSVSGDEFTGTMEWPTFRGCKTAVRGSFDGSMVKWTETAYLKGDDVVLHGLYLATFKANDELSGDWMDPEHAIHPKGPDYGTPGATFVLKKH